MSATTSTIRGARRELASRDDGGHVRCDAHTHDWRELASRENDGLEVSLLWSTSADRVKVTVADSQARPRVRARRRRRATRSRPSTTRSRSRPPGASASASPPASPSTCSRRAEKEHAHVTAQALEELRGPHGPLERQPLEDSRRPAGSPSSSCRVFVGMQVGTKQIKQNDTNVGESHTADKIISDAGFTVDKKGETIEEQTEMVLHPVEDADREGSGLQGRDRGRRSRPSARSRR